ncbi:MAG TPA: hypothetical protein ENJ68_06770 [Devosia sp.]|nr:hypothetical protein [Devosia sp.]
MERRWHIGAGQKGLAGWSFALFVAALVALWPATGMAERLVSKLSVQEISINSSFSGGSITLFGNVENAVGSNEVVEGPFDIIVVIQGMATDKVVREKSRQAGVWLNAEQVTFSGVPSFYHVLSTRPIDKIIDAQLRAELGISLSAQIRSDDAPSGAVRQKFTAQLIRLMEQDNMYGINPHGVAFHSDSFYSANLALPSDVPNGSFLATTYLFRGGELVDDNAERFVVRTVGVERFIANSARDYPLVYGIACVLLAIFTGWLGGVAFRR